MINRKPIYVTKPYLPDINKYKNYIDLIYSSGQLTNDGNLVQELEKRLEDYLDVKNVVCVSNGTMALQLAYKALELQGEVITSPFSFIATTSSLIWDNLKPAFVDIDKKTLNLDFRKITPLINKNTSAILPVHVFGNPCEVEKIEDIVSQNKIKLIYDASHAFGVKYKGRSVLSYGDISTLSFHATKLFHTIEGGALVCKSDDLAEKIKQMRNFGFNRGNIQGLGINAKMNEFQAAMGICILDDIDLIRKKRQQVWEIYREELQNIIEFQVWNPNSLNNYAYAPIILNSEKDLLSIDRKLQEINIFSRRYFYPSLDSIKFIKGKRNSLNSIDISSRIMCLPLYENLELEDISRIIATIKKNLV